VGARADRETDAKRRVPYTANAERARARPDDPQATAPIDEDSPPAPTNEHAWRRTGAQRNGHATRSGVDGARPGTAARGRFCRAAPDRR
jgi:hypothetical protein